jgi:transcriptional regulator with GAF, ATPase, and Fis domain
VKETLDILIGISPAIQAIRAEIESAAACEAKVLVTGESGVGKEVVARLIHQRSTRSRVPLVSINCVGIPETLLESELFGHVRGSFTGAHRDRVGLLEMGNGGTVFLDEVGEMGARMQALLLRFLETGELQRVGDDRAQKLVNVRVIAATNRDLPAEVAAKVFREDLYYRLNVIEIVIPPLRERREDIPVLLEHYLRKYSEQHAMMRPTIGAEAMTWLLEYEWPGNVRQLKNVVERLIVRRCDSIVGVADLPGAVCDRRTAVAPASPVREFPPGAAAPGGSGADAVVDTMFERMVQQRESFWSAVYAPYVARDLTRTDLRALITRGLQETAGNYKLLVELFNMAPTDYKRFLNFLRKQQCQVPYAAFRAVRGRQRAIADTSFSPKAASPAGLRH